MEIKNEIRELHGRKYEVIKTLCDCICHKQPGVRHIMACCNNGFIEHLIEIKSTMETTINVNEVKKELYKSKVNAKFSHYTSGNLYYTVDLSDGTYQFPMSTTERCSLIAIETLVKGKIIELEAIEPDTEEQKTAVDNEIDTFKSELGKILSLSSDLGTTNFCAEVKGSELNRWIVKAIEKNDFIKIS